MYRKKKEEVSELPEDDWFFFTLSLSLYLAVCYSMLFNMCQKSLEFFLSAMINGFFVIFRIEIGTELF